MERSRNSLPRATNTSGNTSRKRSCVAQPRSAVPSEHSEDWHLEWDFLCFRRVGLLCSHRNPLLYCCESLLCDRRTFDKLLKVPEGPWESRPFADVLQMRRNFGEDEE